LTDASWSTYYPFIAFVLIAFSAIRLAKFNNDARQTDSFIGLPTPANAIFVCSLPLLMLHNKNAEGLILHPVLLGVLTLILSFLLVCELPLFSLKFKDFKWRTNRIRFLFLLFAVLFLVAFGMAGIPLTIIFYIILSAISLLLTKKEQLS
jgi:CDP-diacylglycerol---serine O-phosphatidyltransferase